MSNKNEFVMLLEAIEKDKGIPRQEILRLIEGALVSAMHKHIGREIPVQTEMDAETGEMRAFLMKKAVSKVQDPVTEITLQGAKEFDPEAVLDKDIRVAVNTSDFSRIAAQTAKQVILQKLREVEKEHLYSDFKKKESLVITGSVYRWGPDRSVYISLGKVEAKLLKEDQIPGERFSIGQTLKALIRDVKLGAKGPEVYLSRSSPDFLKYLLRLEVPEVHEGVVEVVKVARAAGFRSKILVKSNDPRVEPVGACVGIKGTRIRPVINELHGEKIDLIPLSEKTADMIAASLAPAEAVRVEIEDEARKTARVHVQDDQISGAIGKDGLNLKLAMELTGWNIVVENTKPKESQESTQAVTGEQNAA